MSTSTTPSVEPIHEKDAAFLAALRDVGLLPDFAGDELTRSLAGARARGRKDGSTAFRMDLLEFYYDASGDERLARTRRQVDRFFVHRETEQATASALLERLSGLAPEVGPIALERIGAGEDSTLVLRAGDDFVALEDDEDASASGEMNAAAMDGRVSAIPSSMVTVRGLIRGVNLLLGRRDVRERLVPLRSDVMREIYIAVPLTEAIELARGGHLEEENAEDVMELGGW